MMRPGLPQRIRTIFIVQALLASLVLVGGYALSLLARQDHGAAIQAQLQQEAAHYWKLHEASPAQPPPDTYSIRGYLLQPGQPDLPLPGELRALSNGFHELESTGQRVLVDERAAGRLYLVAAPAPRGDATFWRGVVPLLLTLLGIYAISWLAWRASQRSVTPLSWLLQRVSQWDPRYPDADELAPERLPAEIQGEARQLAAALHLLAKRIGQYVTRERNFTRDASHELRTPLTVIRMASDMALGTPDLDPRLQRSLGRIQRAGRDMEAVVEAFLILAREVDVEPQAEWFEVADIVRYEVASAREVLDDRPVSLEVEVIDDIPLLAPPRVTHVVISNLLRNACTYTDRGRIRVEVGNGKVVVSDTGIGMSPEALAKVFEPFFRAEPGRQQGSGLGLPIVRRLCERFGWRIELESTAGQGTTATVHFR